VTVVGFGFAAATVALLVALLIALRRGPLSRRHQIGFFAALIALGVADLIFLIVAVVNGIRTVA
jgi:hypothetical protein